MSVDPRYPIGEPEFPEQISGETRAGYITAIRELPGKLRDAVKGLDPGQMDTPYREGGWTVRQVVHHVADSHLNAYCRFKLALTEENPRIKPYDEAAWAALADSDMEVDVSLGLIDGLHRRFVSLLESMTDEQYARTLDHPETGPWSLSRMLALYAWHSRHHTAHITSLRERNGW